MMTFNRLCPVLCLVAVLQACGGGSGSPEKQVERRVLDGLFTDKALQACVNQEKLLQGWGDYADQVTDSLSCSGEFGKIVNLSGIKHLVKLTGLQLAFNSIANPQFAASNFNEIGQLGQLTALDLRGNGIAASQDVNALRKLTQLRELHVGAGNRFKDLNWLPALDNLSKLSIDASAIDNAGLAVIASMANLQVLDVAQNNISDLDGLAKLTKLTQLSVGENPISDINVLSHANLAGLQSLSLRQITPIWSDTPVLIQALGNLKNLMTLNLNATNFTPANLNTIKIALESLPLLENLYLSGCNDCAQGNKLTDLLALANLTQLKRLDVSNHGLTDVGQLIVFKQLTYLNLERNAISDLSPLNNADPDNTLVNLLDLRLGFNRLTDITGLSKLTQLRYLDLESNSISKLAPLANLNLLQDMLDLENNAIADVSPLATLTALEHLDLDGNPALQDVSSLSSLTQLKTLLLNGDAVEDVDPLKNLSALTELDLEDNKIGGQDVGNVDSLAMLTGLQALHLSNEPENAATAPLLSCNELTALVSTLGPVYVDLDYNLATIDTTANYCTHP